MEPVYYYGQHKIIIEKDIFWTQTKGDVSVEEGRQCLEILSQHVAEIAPRPVYVLSDATQVGQIASGSRKLWTMFFKSHRIGGVAIYGGSIMVRAVSQMMLSAGRLVHLIDPSIAFFSTEQEARHFITQLRATQP
jgi:hypothetical protein